jgi:hypothetical protein
MVATLSLFSAARSKETHLSPLRPYTRPQTSTKHKKMSVPNIIGHCEPLPYGHGPRAIVDTPLGFLNNTEFMSYAKTALAPSGYSLVYSNEHGSSVSDRYLRYDELDVYDVRECAQRCNDTRECRAFNIFFERSPALNIGPKCKNSLSSTTIKCALWGNELDAKDAQNVGYARWDFQVVVAGSNAYNRVEGALQNVAAATTVPGWGLVGTWRWAVAMLALWMGLMCL